MQYVIMFTMVVMASIADIITGILKAHITDSYDSTIMKKGLYSKCTNWFVMAFSIGCEVGLDLLGQYYDCQKWAQLGGALAAFTVFGLIMLMEAISIFENFAIANPESPLAKIVGKRLRKIQKDVENSVETVESKEKDTESKDNVP